MAEYTFRKAKRVINLLVLVHPFFPRTQGSQDTLVFARISETCCQAATLSNLLGACFSNSSLLRVLCFYLDFLFSACEPDQISGDLTSVVGKRGKKIFRAKCSFLRAYGSFHQLDNVISKKIISSEYILETKDQKQIFCHLEKM